MNLVKASQIKPNEHNPRLIKDDKFLKLVKSITDFPEMANARPIIVNKEMVILGGNMRFKAMKEAGWKDIPVEVVDWAEEKQKEFIIKDNVGFGEWDWDTLGNEWDAEQLTDWGMNVPFFGSDLNSMDEKDLDFSEEFNAVGTAKDLQRVVFIFENADNAERYLKENNINFEKRNMAWQVNMNTQFI